MNHIHQWREYEREAKRHLQELVLTYGVSMTEHLGFEGTDNTAEMTRLSERVIMYICKESKPEKVELNIREYVNRPEVLDITIR